MKSFEFWRRWMLALAVIVAGFGLVLVIEPLGADRLFELMLFSGEYPFEDGAVGHIRFVTGVLGATMAGWGVLLGFILWRPFGERRRWAWWAVATSLGVWFALDTGLSCVSGYWENALLNTVVVAAFVPALGATYRSTTP